ncbi:fumarylacetoacetate hydrolase family protein [Entomomonas asaccharolytica]|uniref:Fumarylacetoacetate hydrolase family protein n=1 Tax=Entomomonas asaccharolytica TaxID=2785331 RepID=A0A974RW92_9GAMM|nr:fumarylacetoacetate hydrolase family protein [Entomomonas asaccharolytica]QQP84935.1 fumarylacetoacetate hydrolase family protein [Entomomonas asaccharolytica]
MSYQHQYIDGTTIHFAVGKVVCVGRNYAEHAKELNNPIPTEPILFIKPATSVVSSNGGFSIPHHRGAVHYEAEIAVLIGKQLSGSVTKTEVVEAITGFAPALDLTLRDVQAKLKEKGLPWEISKCFDGACVLTPFVPASNYPNLTDIDIRLTINGEIRQQGNSSEMLTPIVELIQYIANNFTLLPGDVVLTGTPKGVGPLNTGDRLVMELPEHCHFVSEVL